MLVSRRRATPSSTTMRKFLNKEFILCINVHGIFVAVSNHATLLTNLLGNLGGRHLGSAALLLQLLYLTTLLDLGKCLVNVFCLSNLLHNLLHMSGTGIPHTIHVKLALPLLSNLLNSAHSFDGRLHKLAVIPDRDVPALLKLEGGVDGHFLADGLSEGFGPAELAGITFHLEVFVAFGAAEAEVLTVVADKGDSMAWVTGRGTEEALFQTHPQKLFLLPGSSNNILRN